MLLYSLQGYRHIKLLIPPCKSDWRERETRVMVPYTSAEHSQHRFQTALLLSETGIISQDTFKMVFLAQTCSKGHTPFKTKWHSNKGQTDLVLQLQVALRHLVFVQWNVINLISLPTKMPSSKHPDSFRSSSIFRALLISHLELQQKSNSSSMLAPNMLWVNIFSCITMHRSAFCTAELVKAASSLTKSAPPEQPSIFGYTSSFPSPIPLTGKNQQIEGKSIFVF